MDDIKQMAKTVAQCIKGDTKKTKGYDTAATVKRVDGGTLYVSIPGGVSETPVKKTIDAKVGDTVQVHVENGTAWLTGNRTAPPTDDAEALVAKAVAKIADKNAAKAKTTADEAQQTANAVSGIANTALSQAQEAKQIADDTEQHFWFTETGTDTGAHIAEITKDEWDVTPSGGNLLARSNGIAVREGMKELATMSQNGFDAKSYDSGGNAVKIAHLGYGDGAGESGSTTKAPYYDIGIRRTTSVTRDGTTYQPTVGNYSVAFGYGNIASAYSALVTGQNNVSNGVGSFVGGNYSVGNGKNNIVFGEEVSAGSVCRDTAIFGYHTKYSSSYGLVAGKYNVDNSDSLFEIGNGTSSSARSNAFEVKETGDAIVSGNLTASNIGTWKSHAPSATSCTNNRYFQVAYLTLDPGIWLIDQNALFPATNATGTRQILCTTATSGYNNVTTAPASYGNITRDTLAGANINQYPQAHFPVNVSTTTTFRLIAYQNSGSTMSVTGRMYAIRIK